LEAAAISVSSRSNSEGADYVTSGWETIYGSSPCRESCLDPGTDDPNRQQVARVIWDNRCPGKDRT